MKNSFRYCRTLKFNNVDGIKMFFRKLVLVLISYEIQMQCNIGNIQHRSFFMKIWQHHLLVFSHTCIKLDGNKDMTDVLKELVLEEIEDSIIGRKSLNTKFYTYTTATKSTASGFSQIIWRSLSVMLQFFRSVSEIRKLNFSYFRIQKIS